MIIPGRKEEAGFYLVPTYAKVTGKQLRDARYVLRTDDLMSRRTPHVVQIEWKPEGAEKFYELTKDNVGKQLAIVLDNVVVSAPRVDEPIREIATISGDFSAETAEELVALLKSGAFTAPVEVIEERHIGPSLGQESIHKGLLSCAIALGLLFLFSILVYKVAGLFAFIVLAL